MKVVIILFLFNIEMTNYISNYFNYYHYIELFTLRLMRDFLTFQVLLFLLKYLDYHYKKKKTIRGYFGSTTTLFRM